jgi:hypothetical protein
MGRMGRTSMRSGHFEGKSSSAMSATDSAICARMPLSAGWASAIIAGSSWARSAALSCSGSGATSCAGQRRPCASRRRTSSHRSLAMFLR